MAEADGSILDGIEHIVVLMLENRSFDNVLGWLYDPANAPPFDRVPDGETFDGVSGKGLSNPGPGGAVVPFGSTDVTTNPFPDPGEEYERVYGQLYNCNPKPDGVPAGEVPPNPDQPPPMSGFVNNYALQRLVPSWGDAFVGFQWWRPVSYWRLARRIQAHLLGTRVQTPGNIMNGFRPASLSVFCTLANAFVVCDRWFASVPSQTLTNRSFMHAGTASGHVNNAGHDFPIFVNDTPTIYNLLEDKGLDWRIYYGSHWILCNAFQTQRQVERYMLTSVPFETGHFQPFEQLLKDAAHGRLPVYAFVEPNFLDSDDYGRENDMHPDSGLIDLDGLASDAKFGDELVRKLYQALRHGPQWDSTLLVVTFDEHGGCYDHVPPGPAEPPDDRAIPKGQPGYSGFQFNRYGVRVPALLISPRLRQGAVDHTVYDHTSVLNTVIQKFGLDEGLGKRVSHANVLCPPMVPVRENVPDLSHPVVDNDKVTKDSPLTGLRKTMAHAAIQRLHGMVSPASKHPPAVRSKREVEQVLRSLTERLAKARAGG